MKTDPDTAAKCYDLAGVSKPKAKRPKYGNKKTTVDGITFDSKREAERWLVLKAMERDGLIRDLKRQVTVPLVVNGVLVCRFVADFEYWDVAAERIIHDDSKGFRTKEYRIKAKLYRALYGVPIRET